MSDGVCDPDWVPPIGVEDERRADTDTNLFAVDANVLESVITKQSTKQLQWVHTGKLYCMRSPCTQTVSYSLYITRLEGVFLVADIQQRHLASAIIVCGAWSSCWGITFRNPNSTCHKCKEEFASDGDPPYTCTSPKTAKIFWFQQTLGLGHCSWH